MVSASVRSRVVVLVLLIHCLILLLINDQRVHLFGRKMRFVTDTHKLSV